MFIPLPREKQKLNIPNIITLSRPLFGAVFFYVLALGEVGVATWVFILGALTDFFDGQIARRFKMVTELGKILDPVFDRTFMLTIILGIFLFRTQLWLPVLMILAREIIGFWGLLIFVIKRKSPTDRIGWFGKITTAMQCIAIPAILLQVPLYMVWVYSAMIIGAISGFIYLKIAIGEK